MKKYWTVILSEWRNRGRDGLTLPFVIGSQKYLRQSIKQDIKELFADILSSDAKVYLKYCLTTEEIILGIHALYLYFGMVKTSFVWHRE